MLIKAHNFLIITRHILMKNKKKNLESILIAWVNVTNKTNLAKI